MSKVFNDMSLQLHQAVAAFAYTQWVVANCADAVRLGARQTFDFHHKTSPIYLNLLKARRYHAWKRLHLKKLIRLNSLINFGFMTMQPESLAINYKISKISKTAILKYVRS